MKRPLTKWKWLLIPAIVIPVIVAVLLTADGPDKGVSVTFQTFINHPVNGRMALFVITNQRNHMVTFFTEPYCELKSKSDGIWRTPMYGGKFFGKLAGDSWTWDGTLEPRAWATVAVAIPEETNDWRAAVRSGRPPGKLGRLLFHSSANLKAVYERRPLPGFKVSVPLMSLRTNYSREFTGGFNPHSSPSSPEIR
jgi:hypothetical protein